MMLIFDCDGVLLDSMPLHNKVEARAYRDCGIHITPEELSARFSGISHAEEFRILECETGIKIPMDLDARIKSEKRQAFRQYLQPMPGVHETLEAMKGGPFCIASGTDLSTLQYMLSLTGLYEYFAPHIYSSEMVERGKPSPDLFLYAALKMGCDPKECIVIEDSLSGIQAGLAAGMSVIGFSGGSHCDSNHKNVLEAAGAKRIFEDMNSLLNYLRSIGAVERI